MSDIKEKGSALAEPYRGQKDGVPTTIADNKDSDNLSENQIFKVGNDVYERILVITADGSKRTELKQRSRVNIRERFNEKFLFGCPYYDDFCNVPSHTDYKQVIPNGGNGLYNRYHRLELTPTRGEHPTWDKLINRFEEAAGLMMDYLTILFRYPTQVLPVVCLVSHENGTGKSTVGNAIGYLFSQNVHFLTQNDLNSQFNPWCGALVAVFEEISDGKKALNMIKAMSTAKTATINEKNVQQRSTDMFLKILIFSNNEDDFIKANEDDIRYWVIRMKPLSKTDFDPDFDSKLKAEAAAFLWTLANREITTPKASRMWFAPELIRTEALRAVVQNSRSEAAKDIEIWAADKGKDFNANISDIAMELTKYSRNEIKKAVIEELKMPMIKGRYISISGEERNSTHFSFIIADEAQKEKDTLRDDGSLPF